MGESFVRAKQRVVWGDGGKDVQEGKGTHLEGI